MTAVPPPVPPEIVERVAKAISQAMVLRIPPRQIAAEALAAVYGDIVEAARRDDPCPTCQGRNRATTDMVCMTCGRDYLPDDGSDVSAPGLGWLRLLGLWREQAKRMESERDAALADRDRAVEAARRGALTAAARQINRQLIDGMSPFHIAGLKTALAIVTDLRDATAPRTAPAATDEETR